MLKTLIIELLLICFFPYPSLNAYIIEHELGGYIILPLTSIFCAVSYIRFYFGLKLFKHMTKWTSTSAEYVCELSLCKADTGFAFKATQKENPFSILFIIFAFTCVCLGMSLRIFELLYWETKTDSSGYMDWNYAINGSWCIFVSMCGVGYGDFYAKTMIGRIITVVSCFIGSYFTSMMMVFMTQKSALTENEKKSYNLFSRLKLRKQIEEHNSQIIFCGLKMAIFKIKKGNSKITERQFEIGYSTEKRNIITQIENIKNKLKLIQTFASVSLKEKFFNVSQQIDSDIKEIRNELESLKFINDIIVNFSDCQIDAAKYLKKNCYAVKLLYNIIQKKPMYGKLNNVDQKLKNEFEADLDQDERNSNISKDDNSEEEEFEDNIFNYDINEQQMRLYFDHLFSSNRGRKTVVSKASKTVDFFRKKRTVNNHKFQKAQDILKRKITNKNIMKDLIKKSP